MAVAVAPLAGAAVKLGVKALAKGVLSKAGQEGCGLVLSLILDEPADYTEQLHEISQQLGKISAQLDKLITVSETIAKEIEEGFLKERWQAAVSEIQDANDRINRVYDLVVFYAKNPEQSKDNLEREIDLIIGDRTYNGIGVDLDTINSVALSGLMPDGLLDLVYEQLFLDASAENAYEQYKKLENYFLYLVGLQFKGITVLVNALLARKEEEYAEHRFKKFTEAIEEQGERFLAHAEQFACLVPQEYLCGERVNEVQIQDDGVGNAIIHDGQFVLLETEYSCPQPSILADADQAVWNTQGKSSVVTARLLINYPPRSVQPAIGEYFTDGSSLLYAEGGWRWRLPGAPESAWTEPPRRQMEMPPEAEFWNDEALANWLKEDEEKLAERCGTEAILDLPIFSPDNKRLLLIVQKPKIIVSTLQIPERAKIPGFGRLVKVVRYHYILDPEWEVLATNKVSVGWSKSAIGSNLPQITRYWRAEDRVGDTKTGEWIGWAPNEDFIPIIETFLPIKRWFLEDCRIQLDQTKCASYSIALYSAPDHIGEVNP